MWTSPHFRLVSCGYFPLLNCFRTASVFTSKFALGTNTFKVKWSRSSRILFVQKTVPVQDVKIAAILLCNAICSQIVFRIIRFQFLRLLLLFCETSDWLKPLKIKETNWKPRNPQNRISWYSLLIDFWTLTWIPDAESLKQAPGQHLAKPQQIMFWVFTDFSRLALSNHEEESEADTCPRSWPN